MSGRNIPLLRLLAFGLLLLVTCLWPMAHSALAQVPAPTAVPAPAPAAPPVPALPTTVQGTVNRNANLRGGPGTNYPIMGKAPGGTLVNVVEATADGTWYYLSDGNWIAAFLVDLSSPLTPPAAWAGVPGQPTGVVTTVVTTVITTTIMTIGGDNTSIVTSTTSANPLLAPVMPPLQSVPAITAAVPISPALVISTLLPTNAQSATLASVVEGDVIEVDINGVRETVRLLGIDAPDAGQPGFSTAASATRQRLAGQEILLQSEQTDRDAQNRLLRHVYIVDPSVSNFFNGGYAGLYLNGQLVADGWALPWSSVPDVSRTPELERWALDAARAGRGFWGGKGGTDNAVYALTRVNAPLYSGPGAENGADAVLTADTPLNVLGRSQDGAWIQVRTPRRDEGWLFVPQVSVAAPLSSLPVTSTSPSGATPVPQPGQATVVPVVPLLPGQQVVATPFPGQPPLATPVPGQPLPPTPVPGTFGPTVIITANLRSGPGTIYPVVGTALGNTPISITARNADGTWLQTANGPWIAAGLVAGFTPGTVAQIDVPPTPAATVPPEPTPLLVVPPGATAPTPTITPTPSPTATPVGNPTPTFTPLPPTPLVRLIALDRGNEWVILYNDGTGTQDLTGWVLVSETGDQRCSLQGSLAPRGSLRVWAQVGPDGFSCNFPEPIWENAGADAAILIDAYGKEVSRIQ